MPNDPITGSCDTTPQTQSSTSRPRPEVEEHFQPGQGAAGSMQGGSTKEELKRKGQEAANRISAAVDDAGSQIKQRAGETTRRLKEQGRSIVSQQKDRVADEVSHFVAASHEAANKLEQEDDRNVAHYLHAAADQLDGVVRYVRESDTGRLVNDLSNMARRRPEVFFGGMFIAGMAVARFLKASGRPGPRRADIDEFEFENRAAWDDEFDDFEAEPAMAGAGVARSLQTGSLHEGRSGALSGDIAGQTAGIGGAGIGGLDTGDVPRETSLSGGSPTVSSPGIAGGTTGQSPFGSASPGSEKKHGDKLGSDRGPSCPPGSAGQEVL